MKDVLNKYLLFLIIFLLSACVVAPIKHPKLSKSEIFDKIRQNNPYICSIKRKGVFNLENRFNKSKFKGFIVKSCDNNFKLNILGLFNQVAYKVVFTDGKLEIFKADKNISDTFPILLTNEEVWKMATLLNTPAIIPDSSYEMRESDENQLLLSKDGSDIYIDRQSFKIVEISSENRTLKYSYKDDQLNGLHFLDFSVNIRIKFF